MCERCNCRGPEMPKAFTGVVLSSLNPRRRGKLTSQWRHRPGNLWRLDVDPLTGEDTHTFRDVQPTRCSCRCHGWPGHPFPQRCLGPPGAHQASRRGACSSPESAADGACPVEQAHAVSDGVGAPGAATDAAGRLLTPSHPETLDKLRRWVLELWDCESDARKAELLRLVEDNGGWEEVLKPRFINQDPYWAKCVRLGLKRIENKTRGGLLGIAIGRQNQVQLSDGSWKPPHENTMRVDPEADDRTDNGGGLSHFVAWMQPREAGRGGAEVWEHVRECGGSSGTHAYALTGVVLLPDWHAGGAHCGLVSWAWAEGGGGVPPNGAADCVERATCQAG
mmetsp:Transcript_66273/g.163233  ORF Transcript_66273/g.163233 Transcript_66273/m.163233 type:complete len:336 (-) Transcript_66273:305-1312(-)